MPSLSVDSSLSTGTVSPTSSIDALPRKSNDKTFGVYAITNGTSADSATSEHRKSPLKQVKNNGLHSLPNGLPSGGLRNGLEHSQAKSATTDSVGNGSAGHVENHGRHGVEQNDGALKAHSAENGEGNKMNGVVEEPTSTPTVEMHNDGPESNSQQETTRHVPTTTTTERNLDVTESGRAEDNSGSPNHLRRPFPLQRFSSPPGMSAGAQSNRLSPHLPTNSDHTNLAYRHTLQVPKTTTTRTSRDFSFTGGPSEEALSATGRFSPTHGETPHRRRASLGIIRRPTRSMHSDAHADEVPQDEDAMRWTEVVRKNRASKRKRKEEEDDDRVMVGTKVDQGHVNWVTAYNMLTGIRFTVSRTNAKIDRELTDADFTARHKFSFDITGNELTPSAKYDFKFKDYSPWVFRHLRSIFGLDPADYLMSLTSKYILSELGSPGKSGSFFYFSRDYKYIIKTIHHAEHKLLRKILKEYYKHILDNPNTLISQFYGLHRVKIPYGRKIHFVVMNNLFPPHRDIHQMFDLKGSTIGREYKEERLADNPRATLKDLNWLRRNLHLEFGGQLRQVFLEQMRRDVALLQRLHIMDYSLLVGVHNIGKGNEENVREKTLRVYQPGGEQYEENDSGQNRLTRTPSKVEKARKARQLRLTLQKEKPVPMGLVQTKMPDELLDDERKGRIFYSDNGGVRATHEDGTPGEVLYYLGIIDCLTHVSCAWMSVRRRPANKGVVVRVCETPGAPVERVVTRQYPDLAHPAGSLRESLYQVHDRYYDDEGRGGKADRGGRGSRD
jgi:1-phosphatidylinositol-4-phosphate 5-kinase